MKQLTLNFHITEACNFSCKFCFAHWDKKDEIFRNRDRFLSFIEFINDQARSALAVEELTINFAGGEPALLKHLLNGAKLCKSLGIRTSVITNGLIFTRFPIEDIGRFFDVVGVSVDALDDAVNRRIGRVSASGKFFDYDKIFRNLEELKTQYGVLTKINTVVSRDNVHEVISHKIVQHDIDRWKIFRVLPVVSSMEITDHEFQTFIQNNSVCCQPLVEDNDDMLNSYIMINSNGHLYQSHDLGSKLGYRYYDLQMGGLFEGMRAVGIDLEKYRKRYTGYPGFLEFEKNRASILG